MTKAGELLESLLTFDEEYFEEDVEYLSQFSEEETHSVPGHVKAAAKKGLEMRAKHGRGGIGPGQAMARKLAKGKVSDRDVKKIASYHARHSKSPGERSHKNYNSDSNPSNGKIASNLWGGHGAHKWAKSLSSKMDK